MQNPKIKSISHQGGLRDRREYKYDHENGPLITVITVSYNCAAYLEETIVSVIGQTYNQTEYIVIDGGSTDGSLDVLKKYDRHIDFWISEKDGGIYDAMNKALDASTGDYVNFLNAGDTIDGDGKLEKIASQITEYGLVFFTRAMVSFGENTGVYPGEAMNEYSSWLRRNLPNHQSIFFPKTFYGSHRYDLRLKLTADDDYKLLAMKNDSIKFIDEVYVLFERDGVSSNHKSISLLSQRIRESIIVNLKHKRYLRLLVDPPKRMVTFFIHFFFGADILFKFIRRVKNF
jgi:putative colanic acid biosynthesis glycosyltransferase